MALYFHCNSPQLCALFHELDAVEFTSFSLLIVVHCQSNDFAYTPLIASTPKDQHVQGLEPETVCMCVANFRYNNKQC